MSELRPEEYAGIKFVGKTGREEAFQAEGTASVNLHVEGE